MLQPDRAALGPDAATAAPEAPVQVQHLRQVLLWPLRLMPPPGTEDSEARRAPWQLLHELGDTTPWREQVDEYTGEAEGFHERHYNEFVAFLPYVQRFLYGEGRTRRQGDGGSAASPMRVFRRHDVAAVRVWLRAGDEPIRLSVVHADLYFFYGVDLVLLNVEVAADALPLPRAQELLYRFGRAYPPGWDAQGQPLHCLAGIEWLDAQDQVLARGDAQDREEFLCHVAEHRAPRIASHWEFMLAPLVNHHSAAPGALRYRQIEYYRMPTMAYLAVDDPRRLAQADFVRLGLGLGGGGPSTELPLAQPQLDEFEPRFCYDRFWGAGGAAPNTRYLCSGLSLIVVGGAQHEFFGCRDRGVLAQFRHQHFLLFLIAHFQKASLLMFSDGLAEALMALNLARPDSIKQFKRRIRMSHVAFLSFTHRYWFHEVSEQAHVKALFKLCTEHLETDRLYAEVKERTNDMNAYLDADALRRQANTVVRLTVVTIFGLVGTVTTGFLGMNLIAEADAPLWRRLVFFMLVFVPTIALTFYTIAKSKRLSDFLDLMSDERVPVLAKLRSFFWVWRAPRGD